MVLEKWYSTTATVALSPSRALYVDGEQRDLKHGVRPESVEQKLPACRGYPSGGRGKRWVAIGESLQSLPGVSVAEVLRNEVVVDPCTCLRAGGILFCPSLLSWSR